MKLAKLLISGFSLYTLSQIILARQYTRPPIHTESLEGIFYRQAGNFYVVMRFYADGMVMSVSIKTEDLAESWIQINQWFHRQSSLMDLSRGVYSLYHGYLSFAAISSTGKVNYLGIYDEDRLLLNSFSQINGYRSHHEHYIPLSVRDSAFWGVYALIYEQLNYVFRFYDDGTVIHATIMTENLAEDWEQVQMWFHPASQNLMVQQGRYCIQEGRLRFMLGWIPNQAEGIRYEGVILDDSIILDNYVSDRITTQQEYRRMLILS